MSAPAFIDIVNNIADNPILLFDANERKALSSEAIQGDIEGLTDEQKEKLAKKIDQFLLDNKSLIFETTDRSQMVNSLQSLQTTYQKLGTTSERISQVIQNLGFSPIATLPREIALIIAALISTDMKTFGKMAQANRRWNALLKDPQIIREILSRPIAALGLSIDKALAFLKAYGRNVDNLKLDFRPLRLLELGVMNPPRSWLNARDVTRNDISVAMLRELATFCGKGLTELNLTGCFMSADDVTLRNRAVDELSRNCPKLRVLNIPGIEISDSVIINCLIRCPSLRTFAFNGNINLVDLNQIAAQCTELKYLDLVNRGSGVNGISLVNADLDTIANMCPHLEYIDLRGQEHLSEGALIQFLQKFPHLKQVSLGGCDIGDNLVRAISQSCRELIALDLGISAPTINLPNLRITASSCFAIAENLPKLRCLGLGNTGVNDGGVDAIAQSHPGLTDINLSQTAVTDRALASIATHCRNLRNLGLDRTNELTSAGIKLIAAQCKNLIHLRYYNPANGSLCEDEELNALFPEGVGYFGD